jgi:hypothetical protein
MKDQNEALSDLSRTFYEGGPTPTFGRELLDRKKLHFSVESLKHVDEYLEAARKNEDVEKEWNRTVLRAGAYVG